MGLRHLFKRELARPEKHVVRVGTTSREDEIRRWQVLLQSPYARDREKALKNLKALAMGKRQKPSQRPSSPAVERLVLVLDRSDSMGSYDYPPTRLDAAIKAACEMIRIRAIRDPRDQVGVVWFNGLAQVLAEPVCLQKGKGHLTSALSVLSPDDGTDINAGLCKAGELLRTKIMDFHDRIVLLTDGHGGQPLRTAQTLKARGIVIDVIGIGGSPAAVNEELLRKVASTINGDTRYRFIANRTDLFKLFRQLADKLVK